MAEKIVLKLMGYCLNLIRRAAANRNAA